MAHPETDPQQLFDEMVATFDCSDYESAYDNAINLREWLKRLGRPPRVLTVTNRFTLNMAAVNGVLKFIVSECKQQTSRRQIKARTIVDHPHPHALSEAIKMMERIRNVSAGLDSMFGDQAARDFWELILVAADAGVEHGVH